MSRMTKFLKQTCRYETALRNPNGEIETNEYGETLYDTPVMVKCRREGVIRDVATSNGFIIKSVSRYFVDNTVAARVGDRIDNSVIAAVEDYVNQYGVIEGYEVYVE